MSVVHPSVVTATVAVTRRLIEKRRPELADELKRLRVTERKLTAEKQNLVDTIASNGRQSGSLLPKLGEIECELQKISCRVGQVETELSALEDRVVDEDEVRSALTSFDPVWSAVLPDERARIVRLLVEQVTFDPTEGEVEIEFLPHGIRALADEHAEERT